LHSHQIARIFPRKADRLRREQQNEAIQMEINQQFAGKYSRNILRLWHPKILSKPPLP